MLSQITKGVFASLLTGFLILTPALAAPVSEDLPDIGITAGNTLSINQELSMGDFYVRQLRGSAPLIYDPVLLDYINRVGQRLVSSASSVRTPFHFFLLNNESINAFAFFGGNIVLYSSLITLSDDESQFASVIAHEISHITQRHLARMIESQQRNAPLTWAAAIGSVLLAIANPQAGMAALTSTMAGAQQGMITFTQDNEKEADRIGMQTLIKAGFDPMGMPGFMQKLADQSRYATKPPEILLTHPLPESRLTDARDRANQFPHKLINSSQDYWLAKVRIMAMYSPIESIRLKDFLTRLDKGNERERTAAQYGQAILAYKTKQYDQARTQLQPLLNKATTNPWYLDLMTDIDLEQKRVAPAISRLENALAQSLKQQPKQPPNPILQINLANAYIEGNRPADASPLLYRYTFDRPDDLNGWQLLTKALALQGKRDEELATQAEVLALTGNLAEAITRLSSASKQSKNGSLNQARYDARIDQLRALQQRFQAYER